MNRIWMAAAVPLALMTLMFVGFRTRRSRGDTASPTTCRVILAGAVLTGPIVLRFVHAGWRRGEYPFSRADILAAIVFAALDVLIPITIVVLIGRLIYSLKNSRGLFMF